MKGIRRHQIILAFVSMTAASISFAGNTYRWVGPDGVTHYGERPPPGVQAEKVKTYGSKSSATTSSAASDTSPQAAAAPTPMPAELLAQQKKLREQRDEQCKSEKARLATLKNSKGRVRMEKSDGSTSYLSPEEIVKEIKSSEDFVNQACNGAR